MSGAAKVALHEILDDFFALNYIQYKIDFCDWQYAMEEGSIFISISYTLSFY